MYPICTFSSGVKSEPNLINLSPLLQSSCGKVNTVHNNGWANALAYERSSLFAAEFAGVATFLVSERAGYVTGQVTRVDGGFIRAI
jgi:NAD(P)-dependent dehydrogenase (short-subunit alcohol dehydrogenase family)